MLFRSVTDRGEGLPLVLLHGVSMSAAYFHPVIDPLAAAGYRVIVPDLRGHGRSPHAEGGHTIGQYADDVNALLDALGIDARYEAWDTPPEDLPAAIERLRSRDVLGANVTVPHKVAAMRLVEAGHVLVVAPTNGISYLVPTQHIGVSDVVANHSDVMASADIYFKCDEAPAGFTAGHVEIGRAHV